MRRKTIGGLTKKESFLDETKATEQRMEMARWEQHEFFLPTSTVIHKPELRHEMFKTITIAIIK